MNKVKGKSNKYEYFKALSWNNNFLVGTKGSVFSLHSMRKIGSISSGGYLVVSIEGKKYYTHRLVWMVHRDPVIPEGYCINHRDGNKLNPELDNLEMITDAENFRHAYEVLDAWPKAEKHYKWKRYYTVHGERYTTVQKASEAAGVSRETVRRRCLMSIPGYGTIQSETQQLSA